jgi:transposase-like protein
MEHTRIDEGIKRGPRKPRNKRTSLGQFAPILPRTQDSIKLAITEYKQGASLAQLAQKHGVTKQAIYGWLLADLGGPEHDRLVTEALTARIAKADESLDTADSPLDLARAREQCRWSRMDLERRRPSLYGQKQEVTHNLPNGPLINIQLSGQSVVHLQQDAAQQSASTDVVLAQHVITKD